MQKIKRIIPNIPPTWSVFKDGTDTSGQKAYRFLPIPVICLIEESDASGETTVIEPRASDDAGNYFDPRQHCDFVGFVYDEYSMTNRDHLEKLEEDRNARKE